MLKRISELLLIVVILFTVFNSINNPTIFNMSVLGLFLITISTWAATHRVINKIPKTPENIELIGFITISYGFYMYLENSVINSSLRVIETFLFVLFSIFVGFVIWNLTIMIIMNIVVHTIDIENTVQDDPFNDPHAAKILHEDN